MTDLWEHDTPVTDFEIDVPAWIEPDITAVDVASIIQGGCASGAYMPAVTYHQALATMAEHGDDVLTFIENETGSSLPTPPPGESWSGMACFYLSYAVEVWAGSVEYALEEAIEEKAA